MHGIPDDFPHHLLMGAVLEQICIGQHDVQFRFDREISISVESSLRLNGGGPRISNFGGIATSLCGLLGNAITSSDARDHKVLMLTLGETRLEIFDNSSGYESFVVTLKETKIVV